MPIILLVLLALMSCASDNPPPTATIESIEPNPAVKGGDVEFTGSGQDRTGNITAYRWRSDLGGDLSGNATFSTSELSAGNHKITFSVQDNNGDWSVPVQHVLVVTQPVAEIIKDNRDPDTTITGTWHKSEGLNSYDRQDPNADYLRAQGGDDTFTWHFIPRQTGLYEVWEWHGGGEAQTSAAPHSILHADGKTVVSVNQAENAGQWNSIGTYSFAAGEQYHVTITSVAGSADTCADAIKLTMLPSPDTPPTGDTPPGVGIDINTPIFPAEHWLTSTPEGQGVDSAVLQQATQYFNANAGGIGSEEMVVVRNGYVLWKGPGAQRRHPIFSGSKTFTTTVLGLLIQEGLITSAEDKAVDYFADLDDTYSDYADITFKQLASMTSGYDGVNGSCWELHERGAYEEHARCVLTSTTPGPAMFSPGSAFKYHDPPINMLGYIMTRIAGASLEDIYKHHVADKIGMKVFGWTHYGNMQGMPGVRFNNPAGTPGTNQGGVITTAEDAARVGLLFLNRGRWKGQQLLNEKWVDAATSNQVSTSLDSPWQFDRRGCFGYMWYTNDVGASGIRQWPSAPPNTYSFIGYSSNFCFVIPEWNMVIVRMSPPGADRMSDASATWDAFFNIMGNGIK